MLSVADQLRRGILVCPVTKERLVVEDGGIETISRSRRYPLAGGVPILLADPDAAGAFLARSPEMIDEYGRTGTQAGGGFERKIRGLLARDYRTGESVAAFDRFARGAESDSVFLSLGGGPLRVHPEFSNVNIGLFPNVDVVADVHTLPYGDASVSGIFCEAGLEHFADPNRVVAEMFRVLRPGARAYSITPFLQAYHGYPDHFQNLTVSGHRQLLERAGFRVLETGPCVGPLYALFDLGTVFVNEYFWGFVRPVARKAWRLLGMALGPLNRRLNRLPRAHVFASTTFCLAEKPGGRAS